MANIALTLPLTDKDRCTLRAGDIVTLTGEIYTARDAAHKRLIALLDEGKPLPVDLNGQTLYYVGPAPASPGHAVGAAGPTTSYRMDAYSPTLIKLGQRGMLGKGKRGPEVVEAMKEHGAVYFGAIGGAGAVLAKCIKKAEIVAYEDLGAEALRCLEVEDLPAFVIIDCEGRNLYEEGRKEYLNSIENS